MYFSQSEALGRSSSSSYLASWPPPPPPGVDIPSPSTKRSSEVLYHPTLLSAHTTLGKTGAWYSTNPLAKRARFESGSNLPIYPQRPGEKDCAHYMLTRTCKFGDSCKFDHPIWVPEGGIPDWKEATGKWGKKLLLPGKLNKEQLIFLFSGELSCFEVIIKISKVAYGSLRVPVISTDEPLPERPGEPDCLYFIKTQRCKYGSKCKFNHPKDKMALGGVESIDSSVLPERPFEPSCAFYMKTGKCKFGASCKFHHPKDILMSLAGQESGNARQAELIIKNDSTTGDSNMINTPYSINQALFHNSKGLPIRPGEVDCPFYMKTGSCKYGTSCRYNHPDRNEINAPAILVPSSAYNLDIGIVNPTASIYQTIDPRLPQSMLGTGPTVYQQRPGQTECDYYVKTGECKFGERCKFHHPIDRSAPAAKQTVQNVKLTLAGLPRREGAVHCPYYMKTGTCKYSATCKFDHPPPEEVMGIGSQETSTFKGGDAIGGEAGTI